MTINQQGEMMFNHHKLGTRGIADRIDVANVVLATFSSSRIERRRNGFYVCWTGRRGEMARRWQTIKGNDFYPVWHGKWPDGGTALTALSQLIRWVGGKPVFPIATWRYWTSDNVQLVTPDAVAILLDGGYPEQVDCVLCGKFTEGLDWWSLNGVSGPCCGWTKGCRQALGS